MKKWTLKARLVLLHTVMMTCIVALMLALLLWPAHSRISPGTVIGSMWIPI